MNDRLSPAMKAAMRDLIGWLATSGGMLHRSKSCAYHLNKRTAEALYKRGLIERERDASGIGYWRPTLSGCADFELFAE
jgi:hypothetical protein